MSLAPHLYEHLETVAYQARHHALRMATLGGCFLGAALSCVDVVSYLHGRALRFDPTKTDPNRDIFLLSKGHAVPALYGVLAALGHIEPGRLDHHLSPNDHVYWHPNPHLPGVEIASGSLGHLPAVGVGYAIDAKICDSPRRVVVLCGDGELNEGSVWEALLIAVAHRLERFTLIIDRNRIQANLPTEQLIPLEPLEAKIQAFGAGVVSVDGHNLDDLEWAWSQLPIRPQRPSVIVADTVRCRGIPSLEGRADAWFVSPSPLEAERLATELETAHRCESAV